MKRIAALVTAVLLAAVISGCGPGGETELMHVHGLGFSADGKEVIVPAHDGLRIYSDGRWRDPGTTRYDFMGYTPVDNGFYSSGHPAPNSKEPDPIGLVKSTDGGKTLTKLGFEGQVDFHAMGVGYKSHAIYVFNPAPVPGMNAGLHYSTDDGKRWTASAMEGLPEAPFAVTVHPTNTAMVALATARGLFLSSDHGDTFNLVGEAKPISSAAFTPTGESLLFGYRQLFALDLASGQVRPVQAPSVASGDAIIAIGVSPTELNQIGIGTVSRSVYLTADGGQTWKQIAVQGKGKASK